MATSLVPSSSETSPARRQETKSKLLNLLDAYAFAFKERIKRAEPMTEWTQSVSTGMQSSTWVSDTLTPEFGLYVTAEEKRKKELNALDVFLAVAPRHMRALADALGDNGEEAFGIMADQLRVLVKQHEASRAETETLAAEIDRLEALMQPGARLPEPPQSYGSQQEQVAAMIEVMQRTNQVFVEIADRFAAMDAREGGKSAVS